MAYYSPLSDRAAFAISGEDARDFLQGLITRDARAINQGTAIFAALLSPQGRFLFDFFILEREGRFLFDMDRARLPELMKRLALYRLRSRVQFAELKEMKLAALWGTETAPEGSIIYKDPRLPALGFRVMAETLPQFAGMTESDYEQHRLSLAVPEGSKDLTFDRSLLLEYGYDELGAVDFDKGCYVGQEVTARSKHRATLRKFIHAIQGAAPLPPRNTLIMAGTREVGIITSASENKGLAHMRVEEVERAVRENTPLMAGGVKLAANLPAWCKTSFAKE